MATATPQPKSSTPLASPETRKAPFNKESKAKPLFPELSPKDNPVTESNYRPGRCTLSDPTTALKAELTRVIYNQDWQTTRELQMTLYDVCQRHNQSAQFALRVPDSPEHVQAQGKLLVSDG